MSYRKKKQFWFTAEDSNRLLELCQFSKLSETEVVRSLLHGAKIRQRPPYEYGKLLDEMNAIGNNVNQIAHQVNRQKGVTLSDLQECQRQLGRLYLLIDERLFGGNDGDDKSDSDTG